MSIRDKIEELVEELVKQALLEEGEATATPEREDIEWEKIEKVPANLGEFFGEIVSRLEAGGKEDAVAYATQVLVNEWVTHHIWGALSEEPHVKYALKPHKDKISEIVEVLGEALEDANRKLEGRSELRYLTPQIKAILQRVAEGFGVELSEAAVEALRKAVDFYHKSMLKVQIKRAIKMAMKSSFRKDMFDF